MQKGGSFLLPSEKISPTFLPAFATEEDREMRDLAARFVQDKILRPDAVKAIEHKDFTLTKRLLRELGELGFLGIDVPEEYGGLGLGKIVSTMVAEQFGRLGSFACSFGAHTGIGTWPVIYFGSDAQKASYLPRLATGEFLAAYALTEAGSGSDAGAAKATAVVRDGGWVLNGEKVFITNGGFADLFIVFAQVPGKGLTAFLVERSFSGVSVGKEEDKLGIRGSSTTTLVLKDVRMPLEQVLGQPGQGLKIALSILNVGRFKLGAFCLGAARQCLADARAYAAERVQFGRSLVRFGLIQEKLAGMAVRIAAMEAVVYRTAWLLENAMIGCHDPASAMKAMAGYSIECSAVKVYCSEALWWIADQNVQVHGGYGYVADHAAERFLRDARINRIFEGTNEINRLVIMDMLGRKVRRGKDGSPPELDMWRAAVRVAHALPYIFLASKPASMRSRLIGAKQAVLVAIGVTLREYGRDMVRHQVLIGAMGDCIIDLYVLDSVLAAVEHEGGARAMEAMLLFSETLPSVRGRVRDLLRASAHGWKRRLLYRAAARLIPDMELQRELTIEAIAAG